MRIIDLTMRITPSIRVFPGSPQPSFIPWSSFDSHGYDSEAMFMSTHTGTHVDAPSHFAPGRANIDAIPAGRLVSSAVLVRAKKSANRLVERADLAGEQIREGDSVVIATGWEKRAASGNYMTENPGLSGQAARYLAGKKVNAVAIDGPSIDAGADAKFTAHKILLPRNILVVENLCNVSKISTNRFMLVLSPLKLAGATGSPARVLAIV
ncbi:MAG TPA: cyclase family protein [Nitrososphaera sp.]|jgi:arylformamidase|nr:cyclase family protein [Nitrososphaera sp.]